MPAFTPGRDATTLVEELNGTLSEVEDAIAGIAADSAIRKRAEGRWSPVDCIEHLVLVERAFGARIYRSSQEEEPILNEQREMEIRTTVPTRTQRFSAPEAAQPRGLFGDIPGALQGLMEVNARLADFVREKEESLRYRRVEHPVMGTITAYEAILLVAAHRRRHVGQIKEGASCGL